MSRHNPAKERYWRRLLSQWRRSGLSGRAFCLEHGLGESSFYAWRRKIARRDQQQASATAARQPGNRSQERLAKAPSRTAINHSSPQPTQPAFLKLTLDGGVATIPAIEVVLGERRLLRVRPGFDAELLRQLLRLLEEPSC